MEFMELLRARHSVRRYLSRPVPEELAEKVLEAVRTAPSAGNFQAYEIYLVSGADRMQALADATFNHGWIAEAPMALVVCTNAARCEYDGKEALGAAGRQHRSNPGAPGSCGSGIGDLLGGRVSSGKGCRSVRRAEGHVPMAVMPFGYANEVPQESTRRTVDEFVHRCES